MTTDKQGRELHDAICDDCGEKCQVPFEPIEGKMLKCMTCWSRKKRQNNGKGSLGKVNGEEFEENVPKGVTYSGIQNTGDSLISKDEIYDETSHNDRSTYNEEDYKDKDGWF